MMRASLSLLALLFVGCFNPDPTDGSFLCSPDLGNICPNGFTCSSGLCVHPGEADLLSPALDLSQSQDMATGPRTCDQIIQAGDFSNLKALTALNTSADESRLAYDSKGSRLLFYRGNSLFSSSLSGGLTSPAAPTAVTMTGGPDTFNGGSFTKDGVYWFSGTTAGVTSLYAGTPGGASDFTAVAQANPKSSTCAFFDPQYSGGAATGPLFMSFALDGCSGPQYVIRGTNLTELGAFYSALAGPNWQSPTLSPTGLTLFVSSVGTTPQLNDAFRSDVTYQFQSPDPLATAGLDGAGKDDRELVVSADCSVVWLVSNRVGGSGGLDLWVANVASE